LAAIESPEKVGLKPFHEFDEANEVWPRGDRPAAIREAAAGFRARFAVPENRVRALHTVDIASAGYPLKFAFGGAAIGPNPYINIINRLQVVQYEDFDGELRTLAYEPTVTAGPQEAPFYEQQIERFNKLPGNAGEFLAYKVFATIWNTVDSALAEVGLAPEDVDFISFDHLHVQDVRFVLGSTEPPPGHPEAVKPLFGNAKLLTQRKEWDTFASLHPMQWAWYVEDGIKGVNEDNVVLLDGDVELGKGVALVSTPGHTDGNHSLVANTEDGVWVDSWHPHLSKIPGVRKAAEFYGREVILNSNTLEDSIDQYDSMVKEKALADPNPRDPRFLNVYPSSEMADWKRQWPVVPAFSYGALRYGQVEKPAGAGSANGKPDSA
jgi:hypothetical protein